MSKKFLSVKIEPEKLIGFMIKSLIEGKPLNITCSENDSENQSAPQYVNSYGISVWVKDSKY